MNFPIYFDNNSTTPVDPRVVAAMLPYFTEHFGNAASANHVFGHTAARAVEEARQILADGLGANPKEIVFTSGATESNNLALKGVAEAYRDKGRHIITAPTEHPSVLDSVEFLRRQGFDITYLAVDGEGRIDLDQLAAALRPGTILVSLMFGNNEIGTLHPIGAIGKLCREKGVLFHVDATQAAATEALDVNAECIDLLSLSAHKMYGPKGVGALYVRKKNPRVKLAEQMLGGGHERGFRSGTLNVPGIVGLAKAFQLVVAERAANRLHIQGLRDRFIDTLTAQLPDIKLNGHRHERLVTNANICFPYVEALSVIMRLPEVAVSTSAACHSDKPEPSPVLRAIGLSDDRILSSIRFGFGKFNTPEEVDYVCGKLIEHVTELRKLSPFYQADARPL